MINNKMNVAKIAMLVWMAVALSTSEEIPFEEKPDVESIMVDLIIEHFRLQLQQTRVTRSMNSDCIQFCDEN